MFSTTLVFASLAALLPIAVAQNATIVVGPGGNFVFQPNAINATVGSVITFVFSGSPGLHSVSQSSFASPCEQLPGGFDSGFQTVNAGATAPFIAWNLTVTDNEPIWFYCKQTIPSPHCLAGMVGGINVPASGSNSLGAFASAAAKLPGLPAQTNGGLGASSLGAFATASAATASGAAASATSPSGGGSSSSSGGSGSSSTSGTTSSSPATTTTSGAGKMEYSSFAAVIGGIFGALLL